MVMEVGSWNPNLGERSSADGLKVNGWRRVRHEPKPSTRMGFLPWRVFGKPRKGNTDPSPRIRQGFRRTDGPSPGEARGRCGGDAEGETGLETSGLRSRRGDSGDPISQPSGRQVQGGPGAKQPDSPGRQGFRVGQPEQNDGKKRASPGQPRPPARSETGDGLDPVDQGLRGLRFIAPPTQGRGRWKPRRRPFQAFQQDPTVLDPVDEG